jgi:hypothetical protein
MRRGPLRNGNPAGHPDSAARCCARTRGGGTCQGPAMLNGRCRMHGGASTGPRTVEGLARMRVAKTKHGHYTAEAVAFRRWVTEMLRATRREQGG